VAGVKAGKKGVGTEVDVGNTEGTVMALWDQ
jgi:hypothetical protein